MKLSAPSSRSILLLLAVVALVVRLAPLLRAGHQWAVLDDSHAYLRVAQGLEAGCGFAQWNNGACDAPELLRTPGYPVLLTFISNFRDVVAIQAALSAATCFLVGWIALTVWGLRAGVIAEAVLAFDAPSVVASSSIMTDCVFQALFVAALALQLHVVWRGRPDRKAIAECFAAAILLAYALLVRPIGLVAVGLAPLPFLMLRNVSLRRKLSVALIATLIPSLTIVGWTWRNFETAGEPTFSTISAYNLYYQRAAGVLWYRSGASWTSIGEELSRKIGAPSFESETNISDRTRREMIGSSLAILLGDPIATGIMTLRCFIWLAIVPDRGNLNAILGTNARSSQFLPATGNIALRIRDLSRSTTLTALVALQLLLTIFVWIGVGLGLKGIDRRSFRDAILILLPLFVAMLMIFLAAGPEAVARHRVPAIPFLAIVAAVGWSRVFSASGADRVGVSASGARPAEVSQIAS
jgi:hypothetical protein